MSARKTFATAVLKTINGISSDVVKVSDPNDDQLVAVCTVRAHLAIAAALLDVADAIRHNGTGAAAERSVERLTEALRDGVGRRET